MTASERVRLSLLLTLLGLSNAAADPCGMVPPVFTGDGPPITRIGVQKTYVCYRDGIESFVIRPGYRGKVDQFGMLIPFPTPPAIRKVADNVFAHVVSAIDPPAVSVYDARPKSFAFSSRGGGGEGGLAVDAVRVLREEGIGMYQVAVLEAGSAAALNRWMSDHGYRYPDGMDATCEDYVKQGWCFVAVKTRVGRKSAVTPKPGMREADPNLPDGAGFDGHVQAMGFRFRTKELVVPMRLSAFNEGDLHNVIYVLAPEALRVDSLPTSFVKRQVAGAELFRNLEEPLPVMLSGISRRGTSSANFLSDGLATLRAQWGTDHLNARRDQRRVNGHARDLFAADLLALRASRLANDFEEEEKALLNVAERLGMRGDELDALHREALAARHEAAADEALGELKTMVLTVIDGDFPREVLAKENLTFSPWTLPADQNDRGAYDCVVAGANPSWHEEWWFRGVERPEAIQPLPAGWTIDGLEGEGDEQDGAVEPPRRQGFAAGPLGWLLLGFLVLTVLRRRS